MSDNENVKTELTEEVGLTEEEQSKVSNNQITDKKIKVFVDGVETELLESEVATPKPVEAEKHELDDDRELKEVDGTDFTLVQRFSHFEYLKNKHIHERKYTSIEEQLDMLYWDKINNTEVWKETVDKIKEDSPKTDTSDMSKVFDEFGN